MTPLSSDDGASVSVIRGSLRPLRPPQPLLIVSQHWPSWLVVAQAFDLPIAGAYFPPSFHRYFKTKSQFPWYPTTLLQSKPVRSGVIGLITGSANFIDAMRPFLPPMENCIICLEHDFRASNPRHMRRSLRDDDQFVVSRGMSALAVSHLSYGGCTSARHMVGFGTAVCSSSELPQAGSNVRRSLAHFLSVAVDGHFPAHPPPITDTIDPKSLKVRNVGSDIVRRDGLLPCHRPDTLILCPSVFGPASTDKYIVRQLTVKEALRVYSIPSTYDDVILSATLQVAEKLPFESAVSSDILTSFAQQLWGVSLEGGLERPVAGDVVSVLDDTPSTDGALEEERLFVASVGKEEEVPASTVEQEDVLDLEDERETFTKQEVETIQVEAQRFITKEKNNIKAAKADDAEVPVHVWNNILLKGVQLRSGTSPEDVDRAANVLREWWLKRFWRKLYEACLTRLRKHSTDEIHWTVKPRVENGQATDLSVEIHALNAVLWHSTQGNWFEYKSGSALHYFRFPVFYQGIAKDGVPVFFEKEGPRTKRKQPKISDRNMRRTVASKVGKVINRGYVLSSGIRLLSLIKYFAVPKTDTDYRIVYDATANKLNDAVWAPSFWLPTIDTLVRYIDADTWMMDRDIGDMFLNFPLDKKVWPYTGLHLEDLFDETVEEDAAVLEKAGGHWVHWVRCLMGFKPSPYNAIKTALVVEEVVKGDRYCERNPYQWDHVRLNLPGSADYDPRLSWISKMRKDGLIACDLFTFVDDERPSGATEELCWQAGHRLGYIQTYLGVQDSARKLRPCSQTCGAWAGAVVHIIPKLGVCVLTSDEKWKRMKDILSKWLERLQRGDSELDHKELLSDRGFLVYLTRNYPAMVPYLKGFHLTIEMWRGDRDEDGWPLKSPLSRSDEVVDDGEICDPDDTLMDYKMEEARCGEPDSLYDASDDAANDESPMVDFPRAPSSGFTQPVPRFIEDIKALMCLSESDSPPLRVIRCKTVFAAVYGFGDASGKGFCGTLGYHGSINYRIGVWGRDADSESSNYKELRNLVDTAEEEAISGRLFNAEFYLFTDNSTAENSFHRGSSKSKLLHGLVVKLRKLEMDYNLVIYLIHVAGTRMIAQGTDGGSRGSLLEGVMTGKSMLEFVELSKTAVERYNPLLDWIRNWSELPCLSPLTPEEWFVEGHGINGGEKNTDGIWIPTHERPNQTHLWIPPPAVADAALEQLLTARHKRTDTYHIIAIPRLMAPRWRRLFAKVCDFTCLIPAGSECWPSHMFEPLMLGIVLPFTHHRPWQLKRAPYVLELEGQMREVLRGGKSDGGYILRKLLKLNSRLCAVSKDVARGMLHMPREECRDGVPKDGDGG